MSDIYTAPSNTTFLPKTTGLVFGPRLVARAEKGRVFGLDLTPLEPEVTITEQPQDLALSSGVSGTTTVTATGNYTLKYAWQFRAPSGSWTTLTIDSLNTDYPGISATVSSYTNNFMTINWSSGPGPSLLRVRIRDTKPDTTWVQELSSFVNITYS